MNKNEPLGLPRGSVRAILAIMIVGSTVVGFTIGTAVDQALVGIAGAVVGYYFAARNSEDLPASDDFELGPPAVGDGEG